MKVILVWREIIFNKYGKAIGTRPVTAFFPKIIDARKYQKEVLNGIPAEIITHRIKKVEILGKER